jgi:hypothetical protein
MPYQEKLQVVPVILVKVINDWAGTPPPVLYGGRVPAVTLLLM